MATPPATATSSPVPAVAAGSTSSRSRFDEVRRGSASCGAVVGTTRHSAAVGVGLVVGDRVADERHAGVGLDGVGDRLRARPGSVPGGTSVARLSGPLKPGPEALGQEVVGLAGGGVLGVVALVGEPEAQPEDRQRQARPARPRRSTTAGHGRCWMHPAPPVRQASRAAARRSRSSTGLRSEADGEAGQEHDHRDRKRDDEQRRDPEPDADQGDGDEAGGDQPAPAGRPRSVRRRSPTTPAAT